HTRSKRDWSSDVCSSDLLQIGDAAANGEVQLPGKHHGRKRLARSLASHRLDDQVFILAKQHPAQGASAKEQLRVGSSRSSILLRSEERRVGKECRAVR